MNESIEPGLSWRPSEGNAPELCVPVHLEATLPELGVLHEALVVERRVLSARAVSAAISALEYMGEQLTTEIRRREALAGTLKIYEELDAAASNQANVAPKEVDLT